jgi:FkbM family methyltransferase
MGGAAVTARAMDLLHNGVCVPDYEKLLEASYSRLIQPGNVVIDVGAHWGRHLEPFARLVGEQGQVFGFEPLPGLARALARRYSDNPRVTIKALALSNRSGKDSFCEVENGQGLSGLKQREHSPSANVFRLPENRLGSAVLRKALFAFGRFSIATWALHHGWMIVRDLTVEIDTIDAQAASLARLDFIKLDVEGGEMDCLRGAEQTIARHRPFMSIEYGHTSYSIYGETILSLFNWARERRYLLSDLFGNIVEDETEWLKVCDVSYWDYFLLPEERKDYWNARFAL